MLTFFEYLEEIKFLQSDFSKSAGEVSVLVDVQKIDQLWKKQGLGYYIEPFSKSLKYKSAWDKINQTKIAIMPRIGLNKEYMDIGFDNGRHTFAVIRDLGIKKIKVSIDKSQKKDFIDLI